MGEFENVQIKRDCFSYGGQAPEICTFTHGQVALFLFSDGEITGEIFLGLDGRQVRRGVIAP